MMRIALRTLTRGRQYWLPVLVLLAALPALAEAPEPPPYYAIENVRVVTGGGKTLESATVLLADGLIEAVGSGLAVPGDAWRIDGTGLTLYPGLIDGLTTLGQKSAEGGAEEGRGGGPGAGPGGGGEEIRGPEDRPETTPWVSAADLMGADDRLEKWRDAGFTSVVSVPETGLFAGQAAWINLSAAEPRERVVAAGVAQRLNLSSGARRSFPNSLMGVFAYIKQVLLDADHYGKELAAYQAAPLGRQRPDYDRTLSPLVEAIAAKRPFLIPGDSAVEVDRALALAREFKLQPVVYGAQGAYARANQLAAAGAATLVSLDWPEPEKDRDPDADTPFRTLYHQRLAPTTPQTLAAAGVPFALYSGGVSSPSQFFTNLRRAVDEGLSEDAALAALTSAPARIFGVADRVGTIERGKIANLVLATGPPWAEDVEVRAVFVDGRKYAKRQSAEPTEPPNQDVSGTWTLTVESPRGARETTAVLEMADDGKVTGELTSEQGTSEVEEGRMSGDMLRFKMTRSMGGQSMQASYSVEIRDEAARGTVSAGPMTMDVSGERTAKAAETKEGGGDEEKPAVSLAELEAAKALYQGPVERLGTFAITNARVYTVSGETLDNATVVVSGGKIRAVGAGASVPAGVTVIDAGGGSLIPGIIDAHSHIAGEGGLNEGSLAVTSMVGIEDVLDPTDIGIYRALAGGVTSANILHGSANPIGGRNQVIKLRWGADAEGIKFEGAPPGIKFALGENPKRSNFRLPGMPQRYPQTRMGVMDVIRQAFTEARAYQQEWVAYHAAVESKVKNVRPPRRDLRLEPLVEILDGERLVHSHCYRADEILQLLRLAEEFGFKIATLQHVLEGYKVADEIAAHGAGASTFSDWWGYKVEAYDAIPYNAALMAERGVLVSINSDSGEEMRHLNQEAAKTMKWGGMSELEALKTVTLNPARQLGIDARVGSIEVGKDADLVLYDGSPLALDSVVEKTFVDGDLYFDRTADRDRQTRIEEIKQRLSGKGEEAAPEESQEPEAAPESGIEEAE